MTPDPNVDIAAIEVTKHADYEPVPSGKKLKYLLPYQQSTAEFERACSVLFATESEPELAAIGEVGERKTRDEPTPPFVGGYGRLGLASRRSNSYMIDDEYSLEDLRLLDEVGDLKRILTYHQDDVFPILHRLAQVLSGLEQRVQHYAPSQLSLAHEFESVTQFMAAVAGVACRKYSVPPEHVGLKREYFGITV